MALSHHGLDWGLVTVLGLAGVGTLLGYLGRLGWLFELACHFRLQYGLLLLFGGLIFLVNRQIVEAVLVAGLGVMNLRSIVKLYVKPSTPSTPPTLRVFVANVFHVNRSYKKVERSILRINPDVVVLLEVDQQWVDALKGLGTHYPASKWTLLSGGFGIVCFSRIAVDSFEALPIGGGNLPSILARLRLNGQPLLLIGTHPLSPTTPARTRLRNAQLAAIAEFASHQTVPVMVVGDLNTTPWSVAFQDFVQTSRLRDSRQGFGNHATWPAMLPAFLRIPIDHALVSAGIRVHARQLGPKTGSDHLPIIMDCSLG